MTNFSENRNKVSVIHFKYAFHEFQGLASFEAKGPITKPVSPACISLSNWLYLLDAHVSAYGSPVKTLSIGLWTCSKLNH